MLNFGEKLVKNSLEKATIFMKKDEPIKGHTGLGAVLAAGQPRGRARLGTVTRDHRRPKDHWPRPRLRGSSGAEPGGPAGEAGAAGSAPSPGKRSLVLFPTGASPTEPQAPQPWPWPWFDPHNPQDPPFGARRLLPAPHGCDGADGRTAASQPGPGVPFAFLACAAIFTRA